MRRVQTLCTEQMACQVYPGAKKLEASAQYELLTFIL